MRLVKQVLDDLDKDPKRFVPRGIHAQISNAKNQLVTPAQYRERVASFYDQTVAEVYELYQKRLHASNAVDFDDMLMLTVEVLERFPEARKRWQNAFRYVLVDEYQDTNHAQYRLLQLLGEKHQNVCAVGDPDQSIYAFRGADIRNILEFERDFPETRTIALEQNYRSTNAILEAANAVIANNSERKEKRLWSELGDGDPVRVIEVEDEHSEARYVAAQIAGLVEQDFSGSEIAVFYRMNAQSRVIEQVAAAAGDRLPGDRRPALLRARRGEGRDRLPPGARQPARCRLAAADREPAAARDRRHHARAPRHLRRRPRDLRSTRRSPILRRPGSARRR